MSFLDQISSPTLLIDEKITRANIKRMADKAHSQGKKLVPHWKTAQSHEIGKWAEDYGITEVTASSIKLAEYLCGQGWKNIHIAFPFNIRETKRLDRLAEKQSLSVQIVNPITAKHLADNLTHEVGFFIEIDAGYGRTGVHVSDFGTIEEILRASKKSNHLKFKGFYLHPGHTYYTADKAGIYDQSKDALRMLKTKYQSEFPDLVTRIGDTPGCSVMEDFGDVDELGPGNFVFFDLMQAEMGSCRKEDISVCLAVPVVDINLQRKEILVHGGGVHLAKDVLVDEKGNKNFGEVVLLNEKGWEILKDRSYLKSISQEHGVIKASDSLLQSVKIGDLLGILPIHSCMTADCMGAYLSLDGKWIDHAEGCH
ncbi:D-serine deaminase-like pyridoxal phosphate-dependent protein [Algoriphagus boseongensis]|uniref:D-serine deaminase-like pyridoxal phosphate-dependent protein n=1 Tax=Algoriphagus boseongensis TaxID=1442587 RepID=A0A4R6T767_9BACT|nr:alanine racemase [Algoriphagus boseongensis]TDQ18840.1 D-serine deaminase-like pyridoxal phosphate-dependent protein [Algoriphagus boseongensis]